MIHDQLNAGMPLPPFSRWVAFHPGIPGCDSVQLHEQSLAGPAAVLLVGDKPLVICGIALLSERVGEAWTVIADEKHEFPLLLTRAVKQAIAITVKSHNLHRVQMTVNSASNEAVRWAFALGFTVEALMRKYGDDESDHYLFVRL